MEDLILGLESFENRRREYKPWSGDQDALAAFSYIESTGFESPRKQTKPKRELNTNRLKWFDDSRHYGYTMGGVFIHRKEVIEGKPSKGAIVECEVKETAKGLRGINVRVKN